MSKRLFLPALQGSFGDWTYYSALVNTSDIAERVRYAREIQSNDKLSDLIQRALDDKGRGTEIARYLESTPSRFFNSLVIGVQGGAPSWHPFGLSSASTDHQMESVIKRDQELVGYLELRGDETLFALDGQHRLSGIRTALAEGVDIGDEKLSIIFVPHLSTTEGIRRTRSLFIALNKRVVPVKRRDIIALDEVDLAAILTRHLIDEHSWFSKGQIDFDRFTNSLPATSHAWTTIGNFYDINRILITSVLECGDPQELKHAERNRLPDNRIADYKSGLVDFYTRLAKLDPALRSVFAAKRTSAVCRDARTKSTPHVLFRPASLKIVTRIAADYRKSGLGIDDVFKQLARIPLMLDQKPFSETIWDGDKGTMVPKGDSLAYRLLGYMLGLRQADNKLRQSYADWRGVDRQSIRLPNKLP